MITVRNAISSPYFRKNITLPNRSTSRCCGAVGDQQALHGEKEYNNIMRLSMVRRYNGFNSLLDRFRLVSPSLPEPNAASPRSDNSTFVRSSIIFALLPCAVPADIPRHPSWEPLVPPFPPSTSTYAEPGTVRCACIAGYASDAHEPTRPLSVQQTA